MQVNHNPAMTPRIRLVSSAYAYLSKKSDTANYALSANINYVDSTRIATNAHKLQGKDTIALSNKYVDEGQTNAITNLMIIDNAITSAKIQDGTIQLVDLAFTPVTRPITPGITNTEIQDNAVTSTKIQDNTITRNDVISTFKAPYADTSDYVRNVSVAYVDSARISTNTHKLQGKDTIALSAKYVDEGQANSIISAMIVDNAVTTGKILDGAITTAKIADNNITTAKITDNAITTGKIADTNITMPKIQRAGATTGQVLKWTGAAWAPRPDSIGTGLFLPLAGGTMTGAITSTGDPEITMGKANFGSGNLNPGTQAFVAGQNNRARGAYSVVAGGGSATLADSNSARGDYSAISGGNRNTASGLYATVGGGIQNTASGWWSTVGGGDRHTASGTDATVGGGYADSVLADYSFAVGIRSIVIAGHTNSAAFNGQTTTASGQTRVGVLSKASGTFTIDPPLDPMNKILNHYFVESPEMVLIYRGSAIIGADGKAVVQLPDYFDALNENPMVQLTGVGSYEVYVAEKVKNNRFVIGGKPGTEVYWTVTGARKDQSAEVTKVIMPVEQPKTGELRGRSLDDDFLVTTMQQLEEMGQGHKFNFRTASARQRYQDNQQRLREIKMNPVNRTR